MKVQDNGGLGQSVRPGLAWVLVTVTSLGLSGPFGLGCKKVPVLVKLDTPEAAASTLLHLYAAEQTEGLEQVVDPALVPVEVRGAACASVILRLYQCLGASLQARLGSGSVGKECEGAVKPRECTCGETGSKAVAAAAGYPSTTAHGVLRDAHLDAEKCKVTNVQEIDKKGVSEAVSFFSESICEDASASDRYAQAEVACGDARPITIVLRESASQWRLFALEEKTATNWALSKHN